MLTLVNHEPWRLVTVLIVLTFEGGRLHQHCCCTTFKMIEAKLELLARLVLFVHTWWPSGKLETPFLVPSCENHLNLHCSRNKHLVIEEMFRCKFLLLLQCYLIFEWNSKEVDCNVEALGVSSHFLIARILFDIHMVCPLRLMCD